jgi:hypothetical protein
MPSYASTGDHDAPQARWLRTHKGDGFQPLAETRWEANLVAVQAQERVYVMAATYRIGDILLHEPFGKWVVCQTWIGWGVYR